MSSRVSIYSKDGYFIGDIRAETRRSWVLASAGVVGACEWDMSVFDRHATEKYLRWGNYALVRRANLPDWIGVIYPPRKWGNGVIKVKAYQAEKVLEWRGTPVQKITGTAGSIFRQALSLTNAATNNDKPITYNDIYEDNNAREETLGNDALSHIQSVAGRCGQDFEVTYDMDENGRLFLVGNWLERIGSDTNQYLREGYNLEMREYMLEEDGDIWNEVTAISDSSTAGSRQTFVARDDEAIAKYGLYQKGVVFSGVTQAATLEKNALDYLAKHVSAARKFDAHAIDIGGTYNYLRVGNVWNLDLNREGFSGDGFGAQARARILGIEYDDANPKKARIVLEEEL